METEYDRLEKQYNKMKARDEAKIYDEALEWAASWITGAQLLGHGDEVQEFATNMAMSIRAAKRGITKRAVGHGGTRPDDSDPGVQISGKTVEGDILPPCR